MICFQTDYFETNLFCIDSASSACLKQVVQHFESNKINTTQHANDQTTITILVRLKGNFFKIGTLFLGVNQAQVCGTENNQKD